MAKAIETLSGADETAFLTAINDAITTDPGTTRTAIGIGSLTPTLHTASPNNTVNALELAVTGGTTNTDLVLGPKGTGAFILGPEPDGTTTGGNKRGARSVDLQTTRGNANQVASGNDSVLLGNNARASGDFSSAFGYEAKATNSYAICIGSGTASGIAGFCFGARSTASGIQSIALGGDYNTSSSNNSATLGGYSNLASGSHSLAVGVNGKSDRYNMFAHGGVEWDISTPGQAQYSRFVVKNKTTTNSAVTLFLDGSSTRLTIPSGKAMFANVQIIGIKSDGTAAATYQRQVAIKNVGGTTSLVGTVNTIGTDEAASTSISITADDTNDALKIEVTGIASETWRWVAVVDGVEVAYGS